MSANENSDIIICSRQLRLDVILPEREPFSVIKEMEEELKVKHEHPFIPFEPKADSKTEDFFGKYGRRWHIEVIIDASEEGEFYNDLHNFCEKHGFSIKAEGGRKWQRKK